MAETKKPWPKAEGHILAHYIRTTGALLTELAEEVGKAFPEATAKTLARLACERLIASLDGDDAKLDEIQDQGHDVIVNALFPERLS